MLKTTTTTTAKVPPPDEPVTVTTNPLLEAALSYAARGWAVLPLHNPTAEGCSCGGEGCEGKHPRTANGLKDASKDAAVIKRWWHKWPLANIGLATGEASGGVLVFDFDAAELYQPWRDALGPALAARLTVQQTGRGYQVILRCDQPGGNEKLARELPDTNGNRETFIETRGTGGYIMAAPSLHPNGKTYTLIQGTLTALSGFNMADVDRMKLEAKRYDRPPVVNRLRALLVSSEEVAATPNTPVDWLTHKFIERGELVILSAPGGSMKSLLMLDWAVAVASGSPWLTAPNGVGGRPTKQAGVLWVNTDNSDETHRMRLRAIMRARGLSSIPLKSLSVTDFELAKAEDVKNLHNLVDALDYEVIVIDTLSGALTGLEENSAKEMTGPAANLRALTATGHTVVVIHHPPKSDNGGTRGSSVLPSKVDRVYSLARENDILTVKPSKERNRPSLPFAAMAALEEGPHETLLGAIFFDGMSEKLSRLDEELQAKVAEALDGEAEGLSQNALAKKCKANKVNLRRVLEGMVLAKLVTITRGKNNAQICKLVGS